MLISYYLLNDCMKLDKVGKNFYNVLEMTCKKINWHMREYCNSSNLFTNYCN